MAILPEVLGSPHQLILQKELPIKKNALPSDEGALRLVVQDYEKSKAWVDSKQWGLRWENAQLLYEPLPDVQCWPGTTIPRSSLNVYLVAELIQSIMPQVMSGLFQDDPPFSVTARPGTKPNAARANAAVLHAQLEDCGFRNEVEEGVLDGLLLGTAVWGWGWESVKSQRKVYKRAQERQSIPSQIPGQPDLKIDTAESDEFEVEETDDDVERPFVENCDIRTIFVNSTLKTSDIRRAKFVIRRMKLSLEDLEALRDLDGYNIPSRELLYSTLFQSPEQAPQSSTEARTVNTSLDHKAALRDQVADTMDVLNTATFEVLERWDGNKVIAVLNQKLVIRKSENTFKKIPFVSVGWWRVPRSFYSLGIGTLTGDEQLIQKALINATLDQTAFNLNLPILRKRGKDALTQNIASYMGRFVDVDETTDMKPMPRLEAVPEAFAGVQQSQARAEATSGANEQIVQGVTPDHGKTSLGRTATGANLLAGGSGARIEAFIERLGDQVFEPILLAFTEMNREFLPPKTAREILSEELDEAFEDILELFNARLIFDISAAARTTQKRAMAQSLPILSQTLLTDPMHTMLTQQGMKVDVNELVSMFFDTSGFKNKATLIVPMTQEDMQRAQAMNPAAAQVAATQAKVQGETEKELKVADAQNAGRAFRETTGRQQDADNKMRLMQAEHELHQEEKEAPLDPDNAGRAFKQIQRQALEHGVGGMQVSGVPDENGLVGA